MNGSEGDACEAPGYRNNPELIGKILRTYRTVAVVGISRKPDRDSYRVAAYLKEHGFRVLPVNPAAEEVLGEKCYPRLADIPFQVDVIDVFRKPSALPELADEIISMNPPPRAVWFQLGVINAEATQKVADAGIEVVQNLCIKIEHTRLRAGG